MDLRSGHAFWPIKNGLLASYPPLLHDEACDVAIIGGGITGALVANRLVGEGVDVVLLDKRDIATGSTAASTAPASVRDRYRAQHFISRRAWASSASL